MPLYLSEKINILFIHIPKTGGTTIENWIMSTGNFKQLFFSEHILEDTRVTGQHFGHETLSVLIGDINNSHLYKFAVVRNPYDRLISEFFYRVKTKDLLLGKRPEKYFSTWVENILNKYKEDNSILDNHIRPQRFFVGEDVNYFKFENGIYGIIEDLANELNIEITQTIESKKVGERKEVMWSDSALRKVKEIYECDFEYFKYSKEEIITEEVNLLKRIGCKIVFYFRTKKRLIKLTNLFN